MKRRVVLERPAVLLSLEDVEQAILLVLGGVRVLGAEASGFLECPLGGGAWA